MLSNTVKRSIVAPISSITGVALNSTCNLPRVNRVKATKR